MRFVSVRPTKQVGRGLEGPAGRARDDHHQRWLASGLLNPFGPPGEIVRLVSSGAVTLCLDARVVSECAEVLRRPKFGFE